MLSKKNYIILIYLSILIIYFKFHKMQERPHRETTSTRCQKENNNLHFILF